VCGRRSTSASPSRWLSGAARGHGKSPGNSRRACQLQNWRRRQFGSDLDAKTQAQIDRGKRIMEIFKQAQYNPIPVEIQVVVIWTVQNGYADQVPVARVKEFQNKLTEYFTTRKGQLLAKIGREKALSDELQAELKSATEEFMQTWQ
jgi:F-type H+-transporting ATPase subunit alpha